MPRPWVAKFGGTWVWRCPHHEAGPVGDEFSADAIRDPWSVAVTSAVKHYVGFHDHSGTTWEPDNA